MTLLMQKIKFFSFLIYYKNYILAQGQSRLLNVIHEFIKFKVLKEMFSVFFNLIVKLYRKEI